MKKSIVILTILSLLVGMLPTVSFAASSYEPVAASAEAVVGSAKYISEPEYTIESDGALIGIYTGSKTTVTNRGVVYYKFNLPDIADGETVTKANLNLRYGGWNVSSMQLLFYLVNTSWDEDQVVWNKEDTPNHPLLSMYGEDWISEEPDVVANLTKGKAVHDLSVDISSMVREYLASGSTEDFSFAIMPNYPGSSTWTYLWPKTATANYPTITLETDVISALETTSVTPAATSDDPVVFEFNNPIDASTVDALDFNVTDLSGNEVEVTDSDFTISDTTVTLSKTWENYGFYQVSLSGISDVYGQALSGSRSTSFEIAASTTPATATALTTFAVNTTDKTVLSVNDASNKKYTAKGYYILYKFDLPDIAEKTVVNANLKLNIEGKSDRSIAVTTVPNGTWIDMETLSDAVSSGNYYNEIDAAMDSSANIIDTLDIAFGSSFKRVSSNIDVSEAVSKILHDDNVSSKYITFAFNTTFTANFYASNSSYKPSLTINLADPSFDALEASPVKGGTMTGVNDTIELTLATSIDKAYANTDYIKLVDVSSNSAADVSVSVKGSKLTVTPLADLNERSEYKIVLKNGIKDTFGTVLDGDKVIHRFTSGTALKFYEIKFTSDASPLYDSMTEITSYNPGDDVTAVAKFENTSNTNLDAIMIIAIYNSDNSLISVDAVGGTACAPANETTQFAKSISVPSDATDTYIKAFIWSDLEDIRPICEDKVINQAN